LLCNLIYASIVVAMATKSTTKACVGDDEFIGATLNYDTLKQS